MSDAASKLHEQRCPNKRARPGQASDYGRLWNVRQAQQAWDTLNYSAQKESLLQWSLGL